MIKLDISSYTKFSVHRSGWGYCMSCLAPAHSRSGIYFDDFLEKTFGWDLKNYFYENENNIPYKKEWIGVIHNPPNMPDWFDLCNSPQAIIERDVFAISRVDEDACAIVLKIREGKLIGKRNFIVKKVLSFYSKKCTKSFFTPTV